MFTDRHVGPSHRLLEAAGTPSAAVVAKKRILVVDDLPLTRRGLSLLIEAEPKLTVCGEAGDAASTLLLVEETQPDLISMGLSLPDMSGVELIRLIRFRHPDVPILVVSRHDERITMEQAFEAGARGYVTKYDAGEVLVEAVHRLLRGGTYVSECVRAKQGRFRQGSRSWGTDGAQC